MKKEQLSNSESPKIKYALADKYKKEKEKHLFKNLRKEVEIGANGTQEYIIKKGINKGKIANGRTNNNN